MITNNAHDLHRDLIRDVQRKTHRAFVYAFSLATGLSAIAGYLVEPKLSVPAAFIGILLGTYAGVNVAGHVEKEQLKNSPSGIIDLYYNS